LENGTDDPAGALRQQRVLRAIRPRRLIPLTQVALHVVL
jgi:hypothetical protein